MGMAVTDLLKGPRINYCWAEHTQPKLHVINNGMQNEATRVFLAGQGPPRCVKRMMNPVRMDSYKHKLCCMYVMG